MIDLGTVRPGSTIRIPFSSFDKDDGSSITMTNYAAADILIYKDGSTTERASTAGFTATTDFDSKTGKHLAVIDLADDTTADFYKAGSEYLVAIDAVTVDAVTTGGWIARFRIGYPNAYLDTSIATLASQTSFTLTAGPAEDDALNGMVLIVHDKASAVQATRVVVEDYTGASKTVTLRAAPATTFTIAAGDNVSAVGFDTANVTHFGGSAGTFSGGRPEVNTTHAAGTAWGSGAITAGSIASDAITAAKVAADVSAEIADAVWDEATSGHMTAGSTGKAVIDILEDTGTTLDGRIPAALVGGRMDANVGAISTDATAADNLEAMLDGTGGVTLTTALTGPITGNITGSLSGSVGSVTGDVGGAVNSVTGNVGGNVTGSVGSLAAQAKADVNAEVLDVLNTDTFAEPGQEAPAATNTLVKKIGYLFKFLRNKITQTSTTMSVFADDGTTVDQKSTVSDDGTTYTRGEIASGP